MVRERISNYPVNEQVVVRPVPGYIPGSNPNQLMVLVRWIAHVHHRMPLTVLWAEMGYTTNPFAKVSRGQGKAIQTSCSTLACWILWSMELPDRLERELTATLVELANEPVKDEESGEWRLLAEKLQREWAESHPPEEDKFGAS